jgi:hypothetical protein
MIKQATTPELAFLERFDPWGDGGDSVNFSRAISRRRQIPKRYSRAYVRY